MSKVTEEKKELKALLIIGRNIKLTAETKKLFEQNDNCLIIGDGAENSVTSIDDIKAILEEKNYKIGLGTRIDISAHGNRTEEYKYHYTDFVEGSLTVQFFEKLTKIANIPLYVHLWSCYGGAANKSAHALGNGSILVTHIESKYPASTALDNYSKQASLTRYLNSGTPLTPYQQFILDLPENYQAATFIKVTDKNPKKFKTLRTTKDEIIVDILNTLDQHTSLTDAVNKFFKKTGEKFKEVFDKENITEAIKAVSTSNDKEIKDFVLGALIHVCGNKKIKEISELRQVKEIKERVRISEILEKLQNKGIDINNSIGGITPLHYACSTGNTEVARTLLEDKADREARTPEGDTPLHNACLLRNAEIVKLLLKHGADIEAKDTGGYTPLHNACTKGHAAVVELLLKYGADINSSREENGIELFPLHYAIGCKKWEVAELLLQNSDLNIQHISSSCELVVWCNIYQKLKNKGIVLKEEEEENIRKLVVEGVYMFRDKNTNINLYNVVFEEKAKKFTGEIINQLEPRLAKGEYTSFAKDVANLAQSIFAPQKTWVQRVTDSTSTLRNFLLPSSPRNIQLSPVQQLGPPNNIVPNNTPNISKSTTKKQEGRNL